MARGKTEPTAFLCLGVGNVWLHEGASKSPLTHSLEPDIPRASIRNIEPDDSAVAVALKGSRFLFGLILHGASKEGPPDLKGDVGVEPSRITFGVVIPAPISGYCRTLGVRTGYTSPRAARFTSLSVSTRRLTPGLSPTEPGKPESHPR